MSNRKCSSTGWPCSVWSTSGWNCTPADRRARSSNAAISAPAERAVTVNPSGAADTESPWLIHTDGSTGSPLKRIDAGSVTSSRVRPNSARPVCSTVPPIARAWAWKP